MKQVLYRIPIVTGWTPDGIPIYGFGVMLFFAFLLCTWLAGRRAQKQGIAKELIQDLAIYVFVAGLVGARIVYMQSEHVPLTQFFKIWEGGIVFYGSLLGGAVGFFLAYRFIFIKKGISFWKLADIIAPSLALGLAIGRIGCLLNGCCYGHVACPECVALHFPLSAPPRYTLTERGLQTAAGFMLAEPTASEPPAVSAVEPSSAAHAVGLRPGDVIVKADQQEIARYEDLRDYLANFDHWPRGKNDLSLTVLRDGKEVVLGSFRPQTLGLHPTQVYESISMILLLLLMLAFEPFKHRDGQIALLFFMFYPIHRFLNEMLRNDTDKDVFRGMTLSQNGSILVFAIGLILFFWMWRHPAPVKRAAV